MKNFKKRLISSLALVLVLILSITVLNGCYMVKSGKMNKVEGTYKLTTYSTKQDNIIENGVEMYLVIRADGTGYYAYRDNETEPYVSEIRCSFTQDEEDSSKISYVEVDFGNGEPHKLAVHSPTFSRTTNLNSQKPVWKQIVWGEAPEIDYYVDVDFTRVNKATDFSYIKEKFGDAPILPYGAKKFEGTYKLEAIVSNDKSPDIAVVPENEFVYYYVTLDFLQGTAVLRTMKKSDEMTSVVKLNDLKISLVNGEYVISMGGKDNIKFNSMYSYPSQRIDIEEELSDGYYTMRFIYCGEMTEEEILDSIDYDVSIYLASKDFSQE